MKPTKLFFTLSLLLGVLAFSSFVPGGWTKYSSEEAKAEIKFPAEYNVVTKEKETGKLVQVQVENESYLFMYSYQLHNTDLSTVETAELNRLSAESFKDALGGKMISSKVIKNKNHEGMEAEISVQDSMYCKYRVYIVGNTQHQLVVLYKDDQKVDNKTMDKFFKSFKLKD